MTAAEKTVIGLALQTEKDTPNTTDADFSYVLFRDGGLAPTPINLPLDPEVGGGPLLRNVVKAGVMTGGSLSIIPRPHTLGWFLYGILGKDAVTAGGLGKDDYTHKFTHNTDPYELPWFTGRQAPGRLWGEVYPNLRVASLVLSWRAARFLEGEVSFMGAAAPGDIVDAADVEANWDYDTQVDNGPQFLAPLGDIELPTATDIQVLSGAFAAQLAYPVDEQMIVGSYAPYDLSVVQRSYSISMAVRVEDDVFYNKMMIDPAGGATWLADLMKEGSFKLAFNSNVEAEDGKPYSLTIAANGGSGSSGNVIWTARPLNFRAGRQIIMALTGTFLADATKPIEVTLVNQTAAYAPVGP